MGDRRPETTMHAAVRRTAWLGMAFVAFACGRDAGVVAVPPPEVSVAKPVMRHVEERYETTGRTEAVEKVEIRARVSGYLTEVNFQDGALVEKGQLLFVIDPRPYEAAVLSAEGEVGGWEASLKRAESDVARNQRLVPKGGASIRELETAIASRDSAIAEIKSAKAKLESAQLDLEFTRVTAPIAGRVSNTAVTVGNLVQATTNPPLLTTIVSIAPIYVYFDADERAVLRRRAERAASGENVTAGDVADRKWAFFIGLPGETGYPHEGYLDFIDNRADPSTGTFKTRGVLANADGMLVPGVFVRVRIPLGGGGKQALVPERAIGSDQSNKYVLTLDAQNVVQYRLVELGVRTDDGLLAITKGLGADERVIVDGVQRVRAGITVTPHEVSIEAPAAPK
jgi:RND family efflux transporter MFP subunit